MFGIRIFVCCLFTTSVFFKYSFLLYQAVFQCINIKIVQLHAMIKYHSLGKVQHENFLSESWMQRKLNTQIFLPQINRAGYNAKTKIFYHKIFSQIFLTTNFSQAMIYAFLLFYAVLLTGYVTHRF